MTYGYYDYLENYYEDYYEHYYWPYYYNQTSNFTYDGTYPPSPWERPYPMDIFNPIFWGISLLCAVLSIALLAFILYKIWKGRKSGKLRASKTAVGLIVICLLLHTGFCVVDPMAYYTFYISWQGWEYADSIGGVAWDIFWITSKISLYLVFGNRYYNIFQAATTMNAEGRRKKFAMFGLFMFAIAVQIVLTTVYIVFYYLYEDSDTTAYRVYLNACWAFLAVDLVLVTVISYLLNISILKLIVLRRAVEQADMVLSKVDGPSSLVAETSVNDSSRHTNNHISPPPSPRSSPQPMLSASHIDGRGMSELTVDGHSAESDNEHDAGRVSAAPKRSIKLQRQKTKSTADLDVGKYSEKGKYKLLHTTTRIALTCIISITSTLVYQLVWNIAEELENDHLFWFTSTWSIDAVINMVCVYLSMGIANEQYKLVCVDLCRCHQCCLRVVMRAVSVSTERKIRSMASERQATELSIRTNTVTSKE